MNFEEMTFSNEYEDESEIYSCNGCNGLFPLYELENGICDECEEDQNG